MQREGGCFCGALRYSAAGEPRVVTHCHCLHCRRTSAAAFVTWAEFPADRFAWTRGHPASFESRAGITRTFCAACGTPITYRSASTPEALDLTVCSLDEPDALVPQDHVFADRLLSWVHLDDRLPRYRRSRREG